MTKKQAAQRVVLERTEAFVRSALEKSSKRKPSETKVRAVAKKVVKAMPQRVLELA
ncbi:hypothetical protein [Bradyrhizobium japonicum]|uniref:hypothetical protein n=1 Tax=Bradyrhizobium japonicum TaxID=375 RepID=UPI000B14207E|nr:hypothetical protein [Bradyrhizobium japonicum]